MKNFLAISHEVKIHVSYNPAVKFLGIYPSEIKRRVQINTFTETLIAVLFITAKAGNPNFHQQMNEQEMLLTRTT